MKISSLIFGSGPLAKAWPVWAVATESGNFRGKTLEIQADFEARYLPIQVSVCLSVGSFEQACRILPAQHASHYFFAGLKPSRTFLGYTPEGELQQGQINPYLSFAVSVFLLVLETWFPGHPLKVLLDGKFT